MSGIPTGKLAPVVPDDQSGTAVDLTDPKVWTATVNAHLPAVYRFMRARLPAESVDDLVQDAFVSAARSVRQFDPARGSTWAWLSGIARNTVAAYYRRNGRSGPDRDRLTPLGELSEDIERALLRETPLPDEICQRREFRALVRLSLSTLDPAHQACLTARYYENLSLEQVGQQMNRSAAAANSLLHRARAALREALLSHLKHPTNPEESMP